MHIYLEVASQVLVLIFVLSTLFSVGLLVSARQVLTALQQRRSLAVALCANFVVLPGAALALCWWLQLAPPVQVGLLLATTHRAVLRYCASTSLRGAIRPRLWRCLFY